MADPAPNAATDELNSLRRHMAFGGLAALILTVGIGGWAAATTLAGAVIASGSVVVESNVKKVQHPSGGVIGEIRVREGERVEAGQVVVRLDETITRANLAIVTKSLDELAARQARLEAERDGLGAMETPSTLAGRADEPEIARIVSSERKLFDFRREARLGQQAQLRERIAQYADEIQGLTGQAKAKASEIELMRRELDGVRELWERKLIPISRVTALERDAVRLEGERNQLVAAAAQARGKQTETGLQIIQIEQDLRSEVARELREIQAKVAELVERRVAAEDQLKRVDVRAPQSGFVHQLAVHTVGGVVGPSDPLMVIVPAADDLMVEARVAPQDIDQLAPGQRAGLAFTAFNRRTTPEIDGTVNTISADVAQDTKTGAPYYTVRIALSPPALEKLAGLKLVPGMPVEIFFKAEERTILSYLMKPLSEQVTRAFRER